MFIDPYELQHALRNGISIPTGAGSVKFSAGTSSDVRTDVTFSNSNGVSFGLNGAGVITASVAPGGGGLTNIKVSAGIASELRSDITFSNSGGVTWGLAAGVITATVATNYQSPGAYLTTAQPPGPYLTTAQPPGAYLTTAALSGDTSKYAGTGFTTATTAGTNIVGTLATNGLSMGVPAYLTTATGGAFTPRLDQVLDPNTDKVFNMASNQVQFQYAVGGSFSTNATRKGMFEIDVLGNVTQEADVMHIHQHNTPTPVLDMVHVEADGTIVTGLRLQMAASIAAEINQPLKFTTEDAAFAVGSVPMILGTQMSNSVANLNANFVQGKDSSVLAGTGFTTASTAGSDIVGTLSPTGLSMGIPKYLTTAAASGLSAINISAGTTSLNASAFTFSNANSVTFGLDTGANAGVVTAQFSLPNVATVAGALATLSYFENIPIITNVTWSAQSVASELMVVPFVLPQAASIGYVRFPATMSISTTSAVSGTSINTSFNYGMTSTQAVVILTQMTGANSNSLGYLTSSSATWAMQTIITAGATGSRYTISYNVTYPSRGFNTNNFAGTVGLSQASFSINVSPLSLFSANRWLDIPFGLSLSAGNYWMALGESSSSSSNAGPAGLTVARLRWVSRYIAQQNVQTIGELNLNDAASTTPIQPGMGSWSTNSAVMSTSSMALSNITGSQTIYPRVIFQMIRRA